MNSQPQAECVHCKAVVDPADRFCSRCGAANSSLAGAPAPQTAPQAKGSAGGSRTTAAATPLAKKHEEAPVPRRPAGLVVLMLLVNLGLMVGAGLLVYSWLQRRAVGQARNAVPAKQGVSIEIGSPRLTPARPAMTVPEWPSWWQPDEARPAKGSKRKARGKQPRAPRAGVSKPVAGVPPKPAAGVSPKPATPAAAAAATVAAPTPAPDSAPDPASDAATASKPPAVSAVDEARGRLNAGSIRLVVRHHLPQIRACYDRALKRTPSLAGEVQIRLVVGGDGKAKAATVHSNSTGHDGLGRCIAYTMKLWRYPRPVGGVETEVIYPFAFSARGR